jgi:hypothetical protein
MCSSAKENHRLDQVTLDEGVAGKPLCEQLSQLTAQEVDHIDGRTQEPDRCEAYKTARAPSASKVHRLQAGRGTGASTPV